MLATEMGQIFDGSAILFGSSGRGPRSRSATGSSVFAKIRNA